MSDWVFAPSAFIVAFGSWPTGAFESAATDDPEAISIVRSL
jgi:hypothetical protein